MENVVVDTSVAIKWFVNEPHAAEAQRVLAQYEAGAISMLAPDLLNAEFGNILWKKHVFNGLALDDTYNILATFQGLPFDLTPSAELLEDAFRIAITHRRPVYDAIFLALSVRHRCRFVTADERLFNAVSASFPGMMWVADWT